MTDAVVTRLRDTLEQESLTSSVERSLRQAHDRAAADLDPDLYAALEWPTDLAAYEDYLGRFVRWIPQQSGARAWQDVSAEGACAREVADRLAHFFFLVDQRIDGRTAAEDSPAFRDWLTDFASRWGEFLDTPDSFDDEVLRSFLEHAPEYRVEDSMVGGRPNMPSGWRTFNQFFARQLNAGLRPIAAPTDNRVVTSPADCYYQQGFDIDAGSRIPATTIKSTDTYGSIPQLLGDGRFADAFAGGTFVHYMLPPSAYHRFHLPVSGRVEEARVVQGRAYMQVELVDGRLHSRDDAATGYEFSQTRGVLTVDTSASDDGDLGVVGVVAVGMSHVTSVVLTATEGQHVSKGEEYGYFQFGGSDIVLLFGPGTDPQLDTAAGFRQYGTPVARCSPVGR